MNDKVTCEYCEREVVGRTLKRHQSTRVCLIAQGKSDTYAQSPCIGCSKLLTTSGHRTHKCKELTENAKLQKKLEAANKKIKSLQKKTNVTINIVNNVSNVNHITNNITNNILTTESIKSVADKLKYHHLINGSKSIGDLTIDTLADGTVTCTDSSRKNLKYETKNGKISDDGGHWFVKELCKGFHPKASSIVKEVMNEEEFDFDDADFTIARKNVSAMIDGSHGRTNNRFCSVLRSTIAKRTTSKCPKKTDKLDNGPNTTFIDVTSSQTVETILTQ